MTYFGTRTFKENPSKIALCPQCDNIMCADFLPTMNCTKCKYPLFSQDIIYMPDIKDSYEIAHARAMKNIAKRQGFDDDDTF